MTSNYNIYLGGRYQLQTGEWVAHILSYGTIIVLEKRPDSISTLNCIFYH